MYRFLLRPKWIAFHILVLAGVIGMLFAANWQWGKYGDRSDFIDKVEAREKAEPVDLAGLLVTDAPSEIEYRRVTGTGHYLDTPSFVEILQTRDGVNGSNVVSLFQIDDGPVVVVNRGFVADGAVIPDPPTGTMRIGGTARTSEARRTGQLTDNDDGSPREQIRRIDLDVIADRAGVDVAPLSIDFIASEPATAPPPMPPSRPNLDGGPPYLSYAIQWCIFSLAAIAGWVFAVRRSRRNRDRAAAKAAADARLTDDVIVLSEDRPVQPSV